MAPDIDSVARHYARGDLIAAIEAGLGQTTSPPTGVTIDDLAPVDEFHIGGRSATRDLCEQLALTAEDHVFDVGCGIGGTSRFLASTFGCRVTGADLTPEYIGVADTLTEWTGLSELISYDEASVLSAPYADGSFDVAVQLHVGMNIADKASLFTELQRVLRPGGRLGVYDIMRLTDDPIAFPVPWASDASMSHVDTLGEYRAALTGAGFEIISERNRGTFAKEFFAGLKARSAGGPPPLGLHVIMGADAPTKIANMVGAVAAGIIAPVELIATKPELSS